MNIEHSLSVLVPTRGRPENMARLSEAFKDTCGDSTTLHWILDDDDSALEAYREAFDSCDYLFQSLWVIKKGKKGIVHPLNSVVDEIFRPSYGYYPTILAFLGDDFAPKTQGWDVLIASAMESLGNTGIVYGNDLLQGEKLPTAWFVSRDIAQTLGHLAPRELNHLYVDNYWLELGQGAECIKYLPNVILEHNHPLAGKAEWDETYEQNNNSTAATLDRMAYAQFKRQGKLVRDIQIVKGLKEGK